MSRILLVDDDLRLARALSVHLRAHGYDIDLAHDGAAALHSVRAGRFDTIILDLGLPDLDGLHVLAGIRRGNRTPVLVLSARATSAEKVEALDAGADDYVTKPFGLDELLARVRAAVRRGQRTADTDPVVTTSSFIIDLTAHQVTRPDGDTIRLTPTEWGLLEVLVRNAGKTVASRRLLIDVWGAVYEKETHYLRVYLAQLRRKLEPDPAHPRYLLTDTGMGYRFQPEISFE